MRLSIRPLVDCVGVNSYEPATELSWTEGDANDIYFQLIDSSLDLSTQGFAPPGRRYVPAAGATLSVMIENIDDAKKVVRLATQPFAQDGSIWKVALLATDPIRGSPQLRLTLTEGSRVTHGLVRCVLKIHPSGNF